MLVYFISSQADSLAYKAGYQGPLGKSGYSYPSASGWISEVYVDDALGYGWHDPFGILAKLAFHEIMHNKLERDRSLHSLGGLASEDVTNKSLTPSNIKMLAKTLAKPIKQNTIYLGTVAN